VSASIPPLPGQRKHWAPTQCTHLHQSSNPSPGALRHCTSPRQWAKSVGSTEVGQKPQPVLVYASVTYQISSPACSPARPPPPLQSAFGHCFFPPLTHTLTHSLTLSLRLALSEDTEYILSSRAHYCSVPTWQTADQDSSSFTIVDTYTPAILGPAAAA